MCKFHEKQGRDMRNQHFEAEFILLELIFCFSDGLILHIIGLTLCPVGIDL